MVIRKFILISAILILVTLVLSACNTTREGKVFPIKLEYTYEFSTCKLQNHADPIYRPSGLNQRTNTSSVFIA